MSVVLEASDVVMKSIRFAAEEVGGAAAITNGLRRRFVACVRNFALRDEVHSSVFQCVLSYFSDDKNRPRPSDLDMLQLVVDEFLSSPPPAVVSSTTQFGVGRLSRSSDSDGGPKKEFGLDVRLLPLRLTVDQDTLDFLLDFARITQLPDFVEERTDEDGFSSLDINRDHPTVTGMNMPSTGGVSGGGGAPSSTGAGSSTIVGTAPGHLEMTSTSTFRSGEQDFRSFASAASPSLSSRASGAETHRQVSGSGGNSEAQVFLRSINLSALLLVMDYRAKRLDVDALQKGDLWELLNLLPLLEGLEIALQSVKLHALPAQIAMKMVIDTWARDINRSQILRSLAGITPIRSFANIGRGLTDFVREPFALYMHRPEHARGGMQAYLSRSLVRGTTSFLKNLTVESISLTERVFFATQSVLEYAEQSLHPPVPPPQRRRRAPPAPRSMEFSAFDDSSEEDEWTNVVSGPSDLSVQPNDALEGFQLGFENLKRSVADAGRALVAPVEGVQRGESGRRILASAARAVPVCILKPATGVAGMAATTLRGMRNVVDGDRKIELESKYKVPTTQSGRMM